MLSLKFCSTRVDDSKTYLKLSKQSVLFRLALCLLGSYRVDKTEMNRGKCKEATFTQTMAAASFAERLRLGKIMSRTKNGEQ